MQAREFTFVFFPLQLAMAVAVVLFAIGLCWLTTAFGTWAFGRSAGFYAGLCMATCVGLWLFTRVLIPDVMLTFTIALSMWALLRNENLPAKVHVPSIFLSLIVAISVGVLFGWYPARRAALLDPIEALRFE